MSLNLTHSEPSPELWATAPKPAPADAAIACVAHALTEAGLIPGAEEDWDLRQASALLTQALEHLQSWQQRAN